MAEADGRIREQRENRELILEKMRAEAAEQRETLLQSIRQAGTTATSVVADFVTDGDKMFATITGMTLLAAGVYGARSATGVLGRVIEARVGKPSLVRETSRRSPFFAFQHPIKATSLLVNRLLSTKPPVLQGIVLNEASEANLKSIVTATVNAKKNRAPYRNLLLYGPPGTGKTLFAKRLAANSTVVPYFPLDG